MWTLLAFVVSPISFENSDRSSFQCRESAKQNVVDALPHLEPEGRRGEAAQFTVLERGPPFDLSCVFAYVFVPLALFLFFLPKQGRLVSEFERRARPHRHPAAGLVRPGGTKSGESGGGEH